MLYAQPGKWVGKPRLLLHEGTYHLFLLQGNEDGSGAVELAHATSADLLQWEATDLVLPPGKPGAWDDLAITGAGVMMREGVCNLLYSATGTSGGGERTGLAITADWRTWQRHPEPVLLPDSHLYEVEPLSPWRDPFLWHDTSSGSTYAFLAARHNGQACIGLARSADLLKWECLPPVHEAPPGDLIQMPEVFEWEGHWIMIYGTGPGGCKTRYIASDEPLRWQHHEPVRDLLGGVNSLDCALSTAPTANGRGAVHVSLQREPTLGADAQQGGRLALPKTLHGPASKLRLTMRNDLYTAPINCLDCEQLVVDQMECWRTTNGNEVHAISPGGRTFLPLPSKGNRTATAIIAIDGSGEGGYVIGSDEVIVALTSDGEVALRTDGGYERRWKVPEPRGEISVALVDNHVEVYYAREYFGSARATKAGNKTLALFCDGTLSIVFSGVAVKQFQHEQRYLSPTVAG